MWAHRSSLFSLSFPTLTVPSLLLLCVQTGRPNVDWCQDHQEETIRANVIGALNIADLCFLRGIHLTYYGILRLPFAYHSPRSFH